MCSHYESVKYPEALKSYFKVDAIPDVIKDELWSCYMGAFIRNSENATYRELLLGSFGLIPHWSNDTKIARSTYNARLEIA